MAGAKRKHTERGMGAVRGSRPPPRPTSGIDFSEAPPSSKGVSCPQPNQAASTDEEVSPLALRNTLPVPSSGTVEKPNESGAHRRMTMDAGMLRRTTSTGVAPPAGAASISTAPDNAHPISAPPASAEHPISPRPVSAHPASAPPATPSSGRGRYSSQPADEEVISVPPPSKGSRPSPLPRGERTPLRVDSVGATTIDATHGAARNLKPRFADRRRIASASLTAREALVVSFVDGTTTVQQLAEAAGLEEGEIMTVLTRLTRLGILTLGR